MFAGRRYDFIKNIEIFFLSTNTQKITLKKQHKKGGKNMRKFDGEIVYVRDFILGRDRSTSILYTRRYLKKRLSDIYDEYVKD